MDTTDLPKLVTIYTDGGCDPNPGAGGYGVVLIHGGKRRELSGGYALTTNNRMELRAAIVALETLRMPCRVELHSDSQYLVKAMTKSWVRRWQANGWRRHTGERVRNADLWQRLVELTNKHLVDFRWVQGHAGHPENERSDWLAAQGRRTAKPAEDEGYLEDAGRKARDLIAAGTPTAPVSPDMEAERLPPPLPPGAVRPASAITAEGQPCRKCGTPVVRRVPKRRKGATKLFVYAYYLYCVGCRTMYMVDSAKVNVSDLDRHSGAPAPRSRSPSVREIRPGTAKASAAPPFVVSRIYEIVLSASADPVLFDQMCHYLTEDHQACVRSRVGDELQCYVDLELNSVAIQIHRHRDHGIRLLVRGKRHRNFAIELGKQLRRDRKEEVLR